MISQFWGVGITLVLSGIGSAILYKVVDVIVGLRVTVEVEREGLDSPSTRSAPTTCKLLPGRDLLGVAPTTPVRAHTRQCPDR